MYACVCQSGPCILANSPSRSGRISTIFQQICVSQPASLPTAYSYGRGSEPKYSILVMHSSSRFSKFFSGTWTFLRSFLLFMTVKGLRHFEQRTSCFNLNFSLHSLRAAPKSKRDAKVNILGLIFNTLIQVR